MKDATFPSTTTIVQAEPWEEGHVAHFILHHMSITHKQNRTIEVGLLKKNRRNDTNRE